MWVRPIRELGLRKLCENEELQAEKNVSLRELGLDLRK